MWSMAGTGMPSDGMIRRVITGIGKALLGGAGKCLQRNQIMRADSFSSSLRGGRGS